MKNGADNFTAERIAKLRQNIDSPDISEIESSSDGHLRNWKPIKKPVSFRITLGEVYSNTEK